MVFASRLGFHSPILYPLPEEGGEQKSKLEHHLVRLRSMPAGQGLIFPIQIARRVLWDACIITGSGYG
jgi:hypothetical protein